MGGPAGHGEGGQGRGQDDDRPDHAHQQSLPHPATVPLSTEPAAVALGRLGADAYRASGPVDVGVGVDGSGVLGQGHDAVPLPAGNVVGATRARRATISR